MAVLDVCEYGDKLNSIIGFSPTLLVCQEVLLLDADSSRECILVVPLRGGGGGKEEVRFGIKLS